MGLRGGMGRGEGLRISRVGFVMERRRILLREEMAYQSVD